MIETLWVGEWAGPVLRSEHSGKPCFVGTVIWTGGDFDTIPTDLWAAAIKRRLSPATLAAATSFEPRVVRIQHIVRDPPVRDSEGAIVLGGPLPGRGRDNKRFGPADLPAVRDWAVDLLTQREHLGNLD